MMDEPQNIQPDPAPVENPKPLGYSNPPRRDHFEAILKRLQGTNTKNGLYQGFRAAVTKHRRSGLSPQESYKLASNVFWHKAIDTYRETHPLAETIKLEDLPRSARSDEAIEKAKAKDNERKWSRLLKWVKKCDPPQIPWPDVVEWVSKHIGLDARAIEPEKVPDVRCVGLLEQATDDKKWFWGLKNTIEQKAAATPDDVEEAVRRADKRATAALIAEVERGMDA